MKALIELAMAVSEGEQARDVSDLVKQAMEQFRAESEAAASTDIVELVRTIEAHKVAERKSIKKLKVDLKRMVAKLEDLDRRWAYAQSTNNFLPVLVFFGKAHASDLINPDDFDKLSTVPADWKAKE
ncbi:MAG: hypothetical protein ACXAC5_03725 [Promethearchaeota archaeon]|jgi:hypothetical protein